MSPSPAPIMTETVGTTPVARLSSLPRPDDSDVFVELGAFDSSSWYKDRMAPLTIEEPEARGDLRPGHTVVMVAVDSGLSYATGEWDR